MNFGIVLESGAITRVQLQRMIAAILVQLARDFAPAWGVEVPQIRTFPTEADVPQDWVLVVILPSSDVAGDLGYHSETQDGRKFARVFTDGQIPDQIAETLSHEVLEALADPACNLWAQAVDGSLWALEVSDAVQGQGYRIDLGDNLPPVLVADFVFPAFFDQDPPAGARLNQNTDHPLARPFTLAPEGYSVIMADGKTYQAGGLAWGGPNPAKRHPAARTFRRLIPAPGPDTERVPAWQP